MLKNFKAGSYVEQGDIWLVSLSSGKYLVNDVEMEVSSYSPTVVTLPKASTVIKKIPQGRQVVKYLNKDTGAYFTPERYKQERDKYSGVWNGGEEFFEWSSLEEEFKCRKELQKLAEYTPVYEELPDKEEVVILNKVGTYEDTGSKYITTPISVGEVAFSGGFYKLDITGAINNEASVLATKYADVIKFENDAHPSYLRFAKINGTYAFSDKYPYNQKNKVRVFQTLEDAVDAELSYRKMVRSVFARYVSKKFIGELPVRELIKKLETIQSSVKGLDVKVKSNHSQNTALKIITELKDSLIQVVEDDM